MRKWTTLLFLSMVLWSGTLLAQPGGASALAELHDAAATAEPVAPATEETGVAADANGPAEPDAGTAEPDADSAETGTANSDATNEASDGADDAGEEEEPTVGDIAKQAGEVYNIWKSQGWIAGLAALIYLLVQVTKLGFIKTWLGVRKWIRPLIAFVLGLAGAVFANLAGGVVWWNALLGGIAAGLASPGFNEFINAVTPSGREKRTG